MEGGEEVEEGEAGGLRGGSFPYLRRLAGEDRVRCNDEGLDERVERRLLHPAARAEGRGRAVRVEIPAHAFLRDRQTATVLSLPSTPGLTSSPSSTFPSSWWSRSSLWRACASRLRPRDLAGRDIDPLSVVPLIPTCSLLPRLL